MENREWPPKFEPGRVKWERSERMRETMLRGYGTGMFAEQEGIHPDIQGLLLLAALTLLLRMDNILFLENQTGSTPVADWDAA